ncbi:MAG TPA: RNA polymerase sigma factor [Silvibacterium sp.]|nr:RNA polymerase sigma factor [Silvibacterium sp.]
MSFGSELENLVEKSVFGGRWAVSENGMSTATLTIAEQSRAENAQIAQGLRRHDPELLDRLIIQYQHRLLRYLLFLTGNRDIAEDLFQETWMRVLMRGAQYNGAARFDTWLFTIARNLLIDLRRKRTMASLEEMCEMDGEDRALEIPSDEPTPFELYRIRENGQRVAESLLTLDSLHREVIVLRFYEELSLEEISQVTRAPLSTVKSRLYRGMAALKPRIEKLDGTPTGSRKEAR